MEQNENMEKLRVSDDHDDKSDPLCNLMEQKDVSQKVLLDFLRKCSSKMDSSKALEIISGLIDVVKDATSINLNDFSEMYSSESDYELKVLKLFASRKATQIYYLEINDSNPSENNPPQIESQMWKEITKFKYLKYLSVNKHQFLLEDLMEMCKNMTSLIEIQVMIDCDSKLRMDDPQFVQEFSSSFDKIKQFIFTPPGRAFESSEAMSFYEKFINFGIKHLPNLKRILPIGTDFDMSEGCKEMEKTSQLQHMRLNALYLEEFASKFDKFPSVQSLEVIWNELNDTSEDSKFDKKKLKLLKKFKKIDTLHLINLASPEYLKMFLNILGQKLKFLTLTYETKQMMTINLKQIQETCPLLPKLEINVADVEESQCMSSFTSLRDLKINYNTNSSKNVCLSNLLSPPNLEKVHLSGFQVTRRELKDTTSKIKEKAILTKVNELELYLDGEISAAMKNALEKEGECLVKEVLNMRRQIDKKAVTFEFL